MKSFATILKRSLVSLALVGTLGAAALGSGVAHAGSLPQISATGQSNNSIYVTGSNFGNGDTVDIYVENGETGAVLQTAQTTATTTGWTCQSRGHCSFHLGGYISLYTPSFYLPPCSPTYIEVQAYDEGTGLYATPVYLWLSGPVC